MESIEFNNAKNQISIRKCRLCQINKGSVKIFLMENLYQRIKDYMKIDIESSINLPSSICTVCEDMIDSFYIFHQNCLLVDSRLREASKKLDERPVVKGRGIGVRRKKTIVKTVHILTLKNDLPSAKNEKSVISDLDIKLENISNKLEVDQININQLDDIKINEQVDSKENCDAQKVTSEIPKSNLTEHGVPQFKCTFPGCETVWASKPSRTKHLAIHCQNRPYLCTTCGKSFARNTRLRIHEQIHLDPNDTSCLMYAKTIKAKKLKPQPKDDDDEKNESGQYVCPYPNCETLWSTKAALNIHATIHSDCKLFLCTTCGKAFSKKTGLKIHEKIHMDTKEYVCLICNKAYSQPANLKTHIKKQHEGHRFYCTKCGRAFRTSCSMHRHELTHTGVRDFKCEKCSSAFYTKKELKKHTKYHDGVRAHFCKICYKTFVEKHHLTIHMRKHSGERPYVCRIHNCGKAYTDSQKLKRHRLACHP